MDVKLVVIQGKPEGKEIPLRTPKFLVGRGTECHLRPNSDLVSRHHCLLILGENEVRLRDLGSTNGTLVNGLRITGEVTMRSGDMIQIGPLGFQIMMDPVPAIVPAATAPTAEIALGDPVSLVDQLAPDMELETSPADDTKHDELDSSFEPKPVQSSMLDTSLEPIAGQATNSNISAADRASGEVPTANQTDSAGGGPVESCPSPEKDKTVS